MDHRHRALSRGRLRGGVGKIARMRVADAAWRLAWLCHGMLGNREQARHAAAKAKEAQPDFSWEDWTNVCPISGRIDPHTCSRDSGGERPMSRSVSRKRNLGAGTARIAVRKGRRSGLDGPQTRVLAPKSLYQRHDPASRLRRSRSASAGSWRTWFESMRRPVAGRGGPRLRRGPAMKKRSFLILLRF